MKRVSFEFALPTALCHQLIETGGLRMAINGLQYQLDPRPAGTTHDLLAEHTRELGELEAQLAPYDDAKEDIDAEAYSHTKILVWSSLAYLVAQSVVVFKLTFFSRFGWDVMEPICYFITFYTGIAGLLFFQFFRVDYTYPAAFARLLQRRQRAYYEKHDFDIERWEELTEAIERKHLQLQMLRVPRLDEGVGSWDAASTAPGGDAAGTAGAAKTADDWCTASDEQGNMAFYNPQTGEERRSAGPI